MGTVSKELMNMLSEFLAREIGSKAMEGITYALVPNSDDVRTRKYLSIDEAAKKQGFTSGEVFRVWRLSNGHIFDLDMEIAKKLTMKIARIVKSMDGIDGDIENIIGDGPEQRRKSDLMRLAKLLLKRYNNGDRMSSVALWSRNSSPNIIVSCKDKSGYVAEKFDAFAIRHPDIEIMNAKLLIPNGIRVSRVEPFDILPRNNGVRFDIIVDTV